MRSSLRWRLQVWYALILLAVIASFAGLLYWRVRDDQLREIDVRLEAACHYLDVFLRSLPQEDFGTELPRPPEGHRPPAERRPPGGLGPPDGLGPPGGLGRPGEHRPPDDRRPPPRRFPPAEDLRLEGLPPLERGHRPPPPPRRPESPVEEPHAGLDLPALAEDPHDSRERLYFVIWRLDNSILRSTWPETPPTPDPVELFPNALALHMTGGPYRQAVMMGPMQTRILVGQRITQQQAALRTLAWQLVSLGGLVWTVGLAGGWMISSRMIRPLAAITRTAASISAVDLSGRIDTAPVDSELLELAQVLNATFDRLEAAFEQQRRFTADASHELRTPLTILRTQVDLTLRKPRTVEEYRDALITCQRAVNRMHELVTGLLTLARADAGKLELQWQPVPLQQVVQDSLSLLRPLADEKQITITSQLAEVTLPGDSSRLEQVVTNLLTNAIQHNRPAGTIEIRLTADSTHARLTIADTGPGIPPEHQPHLFERFYRVDRARARNSGGNGLGLAISQSIVEAHGGTLTFTSQPDQGTTFEVRLPLPRAATTSEL